MTDLTNIRLSSFASDIAEELALRYNFRDALSFFHFAMAYALSNHYQEIDFAKLDAEYDSLGKNYNVGSIKKAALISSVLRQIFPESETIPYRYIRVLMIYGTYKIKERLDKGEKFSDIIAVTNS